MPKSFQKKKIYTISIAHFCHDIFLAFFAPMLPLLMARFGLSISAAGILDIARRLPSLFTPLIGLIADHKPIKYFIILTPAITSISMSLMGIATSYWVLFLLLFIAGISSVCFHVPSPVLIKYYSGNKIGKGMSLYMSLGAIAGTVGTFVITMVITLYGLDKSYLLMTFGIATTVVLFFVLRDVPPLHISNNHNSNIKYKPIKTFIPFFLILGAFMFFRAGMTLALTLYLPVYLTQNGMSLWFAGISLSILHFAGAIGMVGVGHISDKYSKRKILFILTLLAVFAMWALVYFISNELLILPCLIMLGALLFSSAPIILALVQGLHTKRAAFINSIYFTVGFFINVTAILLVGLAGDTIGLDITFKICASLPLASLPFLFFLPKIE